MGLDQVQRCAIHPAIGIARAGNSPEEYFTGPEVPGVLPVAGDRYRDPQGRLKRQAARFRIYGYDASGNVVKEITSDEAEIEWTVHLANKKGAWYCIKFAMDIPDAVPVPRRNPSYAGDRADLIIDPGPRSVSGCEAVARFDGGRFLGTEVPLGEIRTDSKGRLLVFGGLGRSASVSGKPIASFDNEEWYDDNSDGPVTARVAIDGRSVEVTPAWVIVGPPDYAPGIRSVLTLYDLLYQVAVDKEWLTPPVRPSFARHIYPLFEAFSNLQWVNAGFYLEYGWGSPDYLLDPENLERLADKSEKNREARQSLFRRFRSPGFEKEEPDGLPPLYGDAMNLPVPPGNPRKWLAITPVQYGWLKQWAEG
ncbi:MAG TPA: LodA/GoxA family CTQ-dependent oxidase, partial [Blastocatellia bacterium]|nr:LodA/GoxA family CTQ-dependent oxidase [Blastocatellia bacterium]